MATATPMAKYQYSLFGALSAMEVICAKLNPEIGFGRISGYIASTTRYAERFEKILRLSVSGPGMSSGFAGVGCLMMSVNAATAIAYVITMRIG